MSREPYIRPGRQQNFLKQAHVVAERGTCIRRRVGCILVNGHNHIIATGYNGPAAGMSHCIEHPCAGADYPSGQGLEKCEAIHAEANALLQCRDVHTIKAAYITVSPCVNCVKLLLNTSCQEIYFSGEYSHHAETIKLWETAGRHMYFFPNSEL